MKEKPKTPYQRLHDNFEEFIDTIRYPHRVVASRIEKDELDKGYSLLEIAHGVKAANIIGYDTILTVGEAGALLFWYKKRPDIPIM